MKQNFLRFFALCSRPFILCQNNKNAVYEYDKSLRYLQKRDAQSGISIIFNRMFYWNLQPVFVRQKVPHP